MPNVRKQAMPSRKRSSQRLHEQQRIRTTGEQIPMTEAEKMAKRLENTFYGGLPAEAAALIREQDAKIKRMAEALRDAVPILGEGETEWFSRTHADALRDAGVGE